MRGREVDFRASASDLLSNFKFGLMGTLDAQRGRLVILTDLVWVRLGATKTRTTPLPALPQLSAEVKGYEFILNPEVGYRALDGEKLTIDALWGIRYWHLGSNLQFTPSPLGFNFSGSRDFVDPLMGVCIRFPLSPKVFVALWADAGGLGAGAKLDYQVLGTIGFNVSRKVSVVGSYSYLYVNYRPTNFVFDTAMSGPVLGLTYRFK